MKESLLPAHDSEFRADRGNRQKLGLTLVALMLLFSFASVAMAAEKSVLFIHTSKNNGPGVILYDKALQAALYENTNEQITLFNEYTELWSLTDEGYSSTLHDFYRKKYSGQHFDLIVVESLPALRFLLAYGDELFPGTPVVFCVMEESLIKGLTLKPNFTGVLSGFDFKRSLESALRLQPDTRHVVVVGGGSPLDQKLLGAARKAFEQFAGQVEFEYLTDLPLNEIEKRVSTLPEHSIVFYVTVSRDGTGRPIPPADSAVRIGRAANAPIYGFAEFLVTPAGGVGGYLWSIDPDVSEVSKTVRRILAGTKPQDIPVYVGDTNRYMFDWRQLRRWGIDEAKLPPGSIVRYKEFSVWELYKWRIVGAVSLIILQALLIIGLLMNRAKRRKAEEASKLSETRYRNVVETQTELICRYQPDTTLTFVNDAYCRYFGKSSEQLIGTKFTELLPEHARDAALAHIASLIENPRSENYEHEVVLPNGETGWHEWVDHVAQSTNGGGIELQGIGRDITERRQAEEELRLSEMRFRHMADTSEIFIWIADVNMLCTYFNRRVLDFTGRTMDQLLGEGWLEIIHPDDVQRCVDIYAAGYEKREPFVLEFRIRSADGEFRWVYDTGSPRLAADGELIGYIGSAVDITDRRTAEEALQIAHEEVSKLKNQLEAENIYLQEEIRLTHNVDEIVGESNAIKYVLFKIEQVAQTETSVLVLGETGTGKELVARAIHSQSTRKERPLVKVNCAALSASLIESELFGHEKGAFTGASARKIGRFELADGATIFLDEIGELPLELQPKLLRVIQEGELERLGSAKTIKVDVRLIAATNRNLKEEVEKGNFREDLWYRLNVFPITLPPLRQRKEDIPLMVEHFARVFSKKVGKTITSISSVTMKKFQEHSWPGNVRELSNVVERALVTASGTVLHVADQFEQPKDSPELTKTLEEIEKDHITRILEQTAWRVEGPSGAARILGLNPSTLRTRMGKLGIQKSIRSFAQSSKQQN